MLPLSLTRPLPWLLLLCSAAAPALAAPPDALTEVQDAYKAGRTSEAMRRIDSLIAARPTDARLRFQKGVMLVDQKRGNEAIQVFQKLVQDYPSLPEPLNNLAVLYVERGDMEKARTTLEAAIRSKPNYGTAFQNLGDLYTRMASRAYARALQIDDADGAPKLALIRNLYEPPEVGLGDTLVAQAGSTPPPAPATRPAGNAASAAASNASSAPGRAAGGKPAASVPAPTASTVVVATASAPSPAPARPDLAGPASRPAASAASAPVRTAAASSPAAVPAKPAKQPPAGPSGEETEVAAAVRAWASAWSKRDLNAYFGAYAPGFKGTDASADAWQAARRVRILGKTSIKVEVSGIKVDIDKGVARASFRQSYTAGTLDVNSRKTLEFAKHNNKWLIRKESVG